MSTQVVLITGALTGIGRAAAIAFAKKGAKVVFSSRGNVVLFCGGGNHSGSRGLPGGGRSPVKPVSADQIPC
jgi:NAD(P)-dependent dehydrogenase (short-subunit alcohol dehydrogenase family)